MKVNEVIEKLKEYNAEAEVMVMTNNQIHKFSFSFGFKEPRPGSKEGCTKDNCEIVYLYVDETCKSESA